MTEHWTKGYVTRYWISEWPFQLKWILESNTAFYHSCRRCFVKQTWSIYTLYRIYPDKSRVKWYYTKRRMSPVASCLSLPSACPHHPHQIPLLKVQWSSKVQFFPWPSHHALVFVVFFLVFGGIRVPSESLLIERDDHLRTLHIGLLRWHQVSFIRVFPVQTNKFLNNTYRSRTSGGILSDTGVPECIHTISWGTLVLL